MSHTQIRNKPLSLAEKWDDGPNQLSNRFETPVDEVENVINDVKNEGQNLSYTGKDLYNYTMTKAYNILGNKTNSTKFNQIKDKLTQFGSGLGQGIGTFAQTIGGIAQQFGGVGNQIGGFANQIGNAAQQFTGSPRPQFIGSTSPSTQYVPNQYPTSQQYPSQQFVSMYY